MNELNLNVRDHNNNTWVPTGVVSTGGIPIRKVALAAGTGGIAQTCASGVLTSIDVDTNQVSTSLQRIWVIAHEMLHAHGLSHSGGVRSGGGSADLEDLMLNRIPNTSTCVSWNVDPDFTGDDSSQAAYRMTGQGAGSFISPNIGFEQTGSLATSAYSSSGYAGSTFAEVVTASGQGVNGTSRYARIPSFGAFIYGALSLADRAPVQQSQIMLSFNFRATSTGNVGWEVYQIDRTYPAASGCGFPGNIDFNNSNLVGGWQLRAGSGGTYGAPSATSLNTWLGASANVAIPTPRAQVGTNYSLRIYNQLNGGELHVDNATLYHW